MTIIDELKQQFLTISLDDWGVCVVIPGEALDLDWVLVLLEEGYRFEGTRLDGKPVVLVQVKPLFIEKSKRKGTVTEASS
ncbi:MAG TPA: hypothetical protein VLH35_03200 [Candidatus Acidoferrales bacterium]|nr:hypothetical protein [Candidatus Acidoferrales bacterium]